MPDCRYFLRKAALPKNALVATREEIPYMRRTSARPSFGAASKYRKSGQKVEVGMTFTWHTPMASKSSNAMKSSHS